MRKLFFAVALALVSLASTAQTSMKINMDPSVKPGDDFWQYAVGGWLKANPLDAQHPENGAFTDLYELNNDRINKLIMAYAEKKDLPQGSDGQKIGALYRLYMDSVSRNRMGLRADYALPEAGARGADPRRGAAPDVRPRCQGI
jgi:putative endopeptidase